MGRFERSGNDLGYLCTGVDSETMKDPAFADLVTCALVLSELSSDVNNSIDNILSSFVQDPDMNLHSHPGTSYFYANGVKVPDPLQGGSVSKAILELESKLNDAIKSGNRAAVENIADDLLCAVVTSIATLIRLFPRLHEPFKIYCKNAWGR